MLNQAIQHVLRYKRPVTTASGITIVSATLDSNVESYTCQFPLPTLLADDVLLAFYTDNYAGNTLNPFVAGAGLTFTQISTVSSGADNQSMLYWARASGGESGTLELGNNDATDQESGGILVHLRNCKTSGNPYEGSATASSPSSSSLTTSTTVTSVANTLGLRFFGKKTSNTGNAPSGWTEEAEGTKTAVSNLWFAVDSKTIPTASTEAASTRSLAGATGSTNITLAVMPA